MKSLDGGETVRLIKGETTDSYEAFHLFAGRLVVSMKRILAFVTKSGRSDALHLYDLDELQLVKSLSFRDLVMIASPSWSPDREQIAFVSSRRMRRYR